jgi:hypothetical protein
MALVTASATVTNDCNRVGILDFLFLVLRIAMNDGFLDTLQSAQDTQLDYLHEKAKPT